MFENVRGHRAFSFVDLDLEPGESVVAEPDAMASMDRALELRSGLNGSLMRALLLKFLGKESMFINTYHNRTERPLRLTITQKVPGEIVAFDLEPGSTVYMQPGAFIASGSGVGFRLRWAGFTSWIMGEGLFRLQLTGSGRVYMGAFGAVIEKQVKGSYVVDNGHLLSYPEGMQLKLQLAGGVFSSFFGGEGILLRLEGEGTIKLQTRSIGGLVGWLNPRFYG